MTQKHERMSLIIPKTQTQNAMEEEMRSLKATTVKPAKPSKINYFPSAAQK